MWQKHINIKQLLLLLNTIRFIIRLDLRKLYKQYFYFLVLITIYQQFIFIFIVKVKITQYMT